jgi:hypothetical protein
MFTSILKNNIQESLRKFFSSKPTSLYPISLQTASYNVYRNKNGVLHETNPINSHLEDVATRIEGEKDDLVEARVGIASGRIYITARPYSIGDRN